MNLVTYLTFNGQCEAAFKFYEKALGAKISFMLRWGDSPMADQAPPEWGKKVAHATLDIGGVQLQGADAGPGQEEPAKGFALTLQMFDPAEAERLFNALAEGGKVTMPLQQTFWAVRFGMLVDQFGIPWMVNCGEQAER
jgi:PhnB protein